MLIEAVLARNLDALMAKHPDYNSQLKLSRVTGVGQTTVGRIRRADGAATIDNVHKIAKAFHVTASQMLDPRLIGWLDEQKNPDTAASAAAIAQEIQEADLNEKQLSILANTLAALKSK